jgi:hypothetical protein
MEPIEETKRRVVAKLWEFAMITPEQSHGRLKDQIACCKDLYENFRYAPALQRLSEIANMDASRTRGRQSGQKAAAKLLKEYLNSIKPDKSGVQ